MSTTRILLIIVGIIFGALCGYISGKHRIYYNLYKANAIGDESQMANSQHNQGGSTAGIIVGFIFLIIGIFVTIAFLQREGGMEANGTYIIFGAIMALFGGFIAFSLIFKK